MAVSHAGPGRSGIGRLGAVLSVVAGGRGAAGLNFRMACEVADALAVRLGMTEQVRAALGANFERWNGRGLPTGSRGNVIPRPMRVAQLAHQFEVIARVEGITGAAEIIEARRGKAYDPDLTDLILERGSRWWQAVESADCGDRALGMAPTTPPLDDADTHQALLVLADLADLKSPWTNGHSRAVAALPCKRPDRPHRPRRWSTTSGGSPCRTRSGTNPELSPATSGTGSNPIRWSPTSFFGASPTPLRWPGRRPPRMSASTGPAITDGSRPRSSTRRNG